LRGYCWSTQKNDLFYRLHVNRRESVNRQEASLLEVGCFEKWKRRLDFRYGAPDYGDSRPSDSSRKRGLLAVVGERIIECRIA